MSDGLQLQRCFWLASYPKSGNTWLRHLLQAYAYGALDINAVQVGMNDVSELYYQGVSVIPVTQMAGGLSLFYRHAALANMIATATVKPCIFKTHHFNDRINGVELIPAQMTQGAVYIARDPRDVAISLAKHLGKTVDEAIALMADKGHSLHRPNNRLYHFLGTWSLHVQTWCYREHRYPVVGVRYEDMLSNPVDTFCRVLGGLGLDVDRDKARTAIELCQFERVKKQESDTGFTEKSSKADRFFTHGTAGHWRSILTEEQARRIENDHHEMMIELGYALETSNVSAAV